MDIPLPQVVIDYIHDSELVSLRYVPGEPWSTLVFEIELCEEDNLGDWSFAPVVVTAHNIVEASMKLIGIGGGNIFEWKETAPPELWSAAKESLRIASLRNLQDLKAPLRCATLTVGDGSIIAFVCESLWIRRP